MYRIPATMRITIGLALLSASLLLVVRTLGIGPDEHDARWRGRRDFCEALAIHSSLLVNRNDFRSLEESLDAIVNHYPDIQAIDLREVDGRLALHVMDRQLDITSAAAAQDSTLISVPLISEDGPWGSLEVSFRPLVASGLGAVVGNSWLQFLALFTVANGIVVFLYLKRTLQYLDPSRVVPDRVRNALDTIPGGLVILDHQQRIVLANKAFAAAVGTLPAELQGSGLDRFKWQGQDGTSLGAAGPWQKTVQEGATCSGVTISLANGAHKSRCYAIHASPILAEDGARHGALVSFDDVTELETQRIELSRALDVLRSSRDKVHSQNEELQRLATRDPLTDCLNRRSFYESLEAHWNSARRYHHSLSFIMVDLDHFKSINDTHGHRVGDLVLQKAAETLRKTVRSTDLVCRFGGEEFGILLPQLDFKLAVAAAERYRHTIETMAIPDITVTASLGVSSVDLGATDAQELIDQADKCLYVAKRQGRNQVVRWDEVPDDLDLDASQVSRTGDDYGLAALEQSTEIPYHAVSALISALAYRDPGTAEHSRRVAELCVITASDLMSARERYVLEIAATLHDIGKIGVPDSILLKQGPLTPEEWEIMGNHDTFGVQIIDSAFACPPLTAIIENHHAWYAGNPREPGLPTGEDIPVGARILAIADAYDAIVSDRVYRKGRSQEVAFKELRRCTETQFDKDLVERFIAAVSARYESRAPADSTLSRQTAVALGQHIERLSETLDKQDLRGLAALAGRMYQTAQKHHVPDLAEVAEQLHQAAKEETDVQEIVHLTTELIDLCRATQSAFLADAHSRSPQAQHPEDTIDQAEPKPLESAADRLSRAESGG